MDAVAVAESGSDRGADEAGRKQQVAVLAGGEGADGSDVGAGGWARRGSSLSTPRFGLFEFVVGYRITIRVCGTDRTHSE